ncbi:flagellar hook-basal body complex protein [Clostridium sp. HCP1S3_B4]|uniref:flagellar hook-basal body complex protein n=1 Tax=unclassified Clostridium TaxID=2614128 RepID=UPI0016992D20|nr:flagellar hook-basal body complex protein [Clostridiales bacterium]MDY2729252.1 flagellar hook-basal body complex protein [Clostridium sp.]NLK24372.1 flagellar basal body rod protein FlgG [Clostridiales bacterium]
MIRSIMTSKTGMNAQQERLDIISNNLANSSTYGYKKMTVGFKDLYQESLDRKGYPIYDKDATMGIGTRTSDVYRDNSVGNLVTTGVSTNLTIDGEGYFKVFKSDGTEAYTRDGSFVIDSNGQLVDSYGNRVEIEFANGRSYNNTVLNDNNFIVGQDGTIYMNENNTSVEIGKLNIYTATGDNAFKSIGDNLFVAADGVQVRESNDYNIEQGFLEGSNVDMGEEMVNMIVAQRTFQLVSKCMQTSDEMWGMINSMRR